ncbi:MAG: MalY/PatB family protein [Myxococcota bacterium]
MSGSWTCTWRTLALRVEPGALGSDARPSLRVGRSVEGLEEGPLAREWIRFDGFERTPQWHLDPDGCRESGPLDERGDAIAEAFARLEAELPDLLARAGAELDALHDARAAADSEDWRSLCREAERRLRHRPVALDALDVRQLEQRRSEKWHTYPRDVLPVWVAEMDFPIAAPIQAELRRFVESSDVGYPLSPRETGLPEVFAERMRERFDWRPDPARVEILSEVVQGLYLAVDRLTRSGEGVVVQTPIYPPFLGAVRDTGRRLVENRFVAAADGRGLEPDLDRLARDVDADTRLLLLCHPHNPTGRVWRRTELVRLAELALAHDLVVVSDEIHADLVFDGRGHVPFASLSPEIAERTITLTSATKAFNIPGLRCAIAHFGSAALQKRFDAGIPRHVRGGLRLHGMHATIAAWRFGQPWLDEVLAYLEGNRAFVADFLAREIPEIRFRPPEATYLAWLDCTALDVPGSPAAHWLREGRVALSDGRVFGPGWERHARLNFATSRPILREALERMARALGRAPDRRREPLGPEPEARSA